MSVLKKRVWKRVCLGLFIPCFPSPFHAPSIATSLRLSHPNPQAFALWLAAWKLQGSGERQGEPFPLQPGSSCSMLSSARLLLQQGPSAPHPSWRRASRHTLLIGKGSPRIFPRTPIFMAAVDAWINAILSNCLGLHAPLCHPSIPGQPPLHALLCLPKPPACASALSLC